MPESVAHDGDAWRPGVVLRFQKAAAPRWRDAKCTKQAGCNELRTNTFRRGALCRERHPAPDERGKLRERVILCAPVEEVRERDRDLVTATRLAHRDQPVRVDVGEWSEKRCAQHRKHRRRASDAERDDECSENSERRRSAKRSNGEESLEADALEHLAGLGPGNAD